MKSREFGLLNLPVRLLMIGGVAAYMQFVDTKPASACGETKDSICTPTVTATETKISTPTLTPTATPTPNEAQRIVTIQSVIDEAKKKKERESIDFLHRM